MSTTGEDFAHRTSLRNKRKILEISGARPGPGAALLGLALLLIPGTALCAMKVITVPYVGMNPTAPHPAYNKHHTTFKAILRDHASASCPTIYYRWNVNGDTDATGNDLWDACPGADANGWVSTTNPYNLSCRYLLPDVDPAVSPRKLYTAKIEAKCGTESAFGTYPVLVYAEVGQGHDVATLGAADRALIRAGELDETWELDVKRNVFVDDALWWLHNAIPRTGTGNAITVNWTNTTLNYQAAAGVFLWSFSQNGHFAAYPPTTYNAYGAGTPRALEDNDLRWNTDPYAEDAARLFNFLLGALVLYGSASEGTVVDGIDRTRIAGTADGKSAICRSCTVTGCGHSGAQYSFGHMLGGLASSGLAGTMAQTGDFAGKTLEFIVQQMVDFFAWSQFKSGDAEGGWFYTQCGTSNTTNADFSVGQWVMIGLEAADRGMKDFGVIVSDDVKYRSAKTLYRNMKRSVANYNGAGSYRNSHAGSNNHNVTLAGGLLVGLGWLGVNKFQSSDADWNSVFGTYSGYTKKQMKQDTYDVVVNYIGSDFFCPGAPWDCWNDCLFQDANARWGVSSNGASVSRGRGNVYAMYSVQKGARTVEPELVHVGSGANQRDWYREFTYYFVNNQNTDGSMPRLWTDGTSSDSNMVSYGGLVAWGVLVQTPTLFDPKPVAVGSAAPMITMEACSGVLDPVSFRHEYSYHQTPQRRIVEYQWVFDTSDKPANQSWDDYFNGIFGVPQMVADPGALPALDEYLTQNNVVRAWHGRSRTALPSKTWNAHGSYNAALRIVDDKAITHSVTVSGITIQAQQQTAPAVSHGGPYVIRAGEALVLEGAGEDDNESCGDSIDFTWKVRNGANWITLFADVVNPVQLVDWALLLDLPRGTAIPLRLEATDSTNLTTVVETELTIYDIHPVACFTAIPDTLGCNERVAVNASCSSHQDPREDVIKWEWDFENDGTVDAVGETQEHIFDHIGQHTIALTVSDALEETGSTTHDVTVEARTSPQAHAGGPYAMVTWLDAQGVRVGSTFRLDGSRSTDPDLGCGDSLTAYAWDINGDGQFNDGIGGNTPFADVTWATLLARLQAIGRTEADFLAAPNGQPSLPLRLRVTDSTGRTHIAMTTLTLWHNGPYAAFSTVPDKGACLDDVQFDASASFHGMPPHQINSYQWDFDMKDGEPFQVEAAGRVVLHRYAAFGTYQPALRVTDDQGRTALIRKSFSVENGNSAPRVDPGGPYAIVVGGELRLDGSRTTDPNASCGDTLQRFEWDLNNDGNFTDAAELAQPRVAWAALSGLLRQGVHYPADPGTGLPVIPVKLRVTDGFGVSAVGETRLTVYRNTPIAAAVWGPQPKVPVDVGGWATVQFDGSGSRPGNPFTSITAWNWTYEGQVGGENGQLSSMRFRVVNDLSLLPKTVKFRLLVTDSAGQTATTEFNVLFDRVPSAPPAVSFQGGNEKHIQVGDALSVQGIVSDPDFDANNPNKEWVALVSWDLDGVVENPEDLVRPLQDTNNDGAINGADIPDLALNLTWAELAAHGLQPVGTHPIKLKVVDKTGTLGEATLNLVVHDSALVAVADVVPRSGSCHTSFAYDGRSSRHLFPGKTIASWRWDFDGNGSWDGAGAQTAHQFNRFGVYTSRLEVRDTLGHVATTTVQVSTQQGNLPPQLDHGGPYFVDLFQDLSLTLDASGSSEPDADCGDSIVAYRWDLDGDGVFEHETDEAVLELPWAAIADLPQNDVDHRITLQLVDTLGGTSQGSTTLLISDGAPLAAFTFDPHPSSCGQEVTFDASASYHPRPDRQIVKYEWDFAYDGETFEPAQQLGMQVRYVFPSMGAHRVALRVTDNGAPARTHVITHDTETSGDNLPPVASTGGTLRAAYGEPLALDARASFDPNAICGDAVVKFEWDLNNDLNGNQQFDKTYATPLNTLPWAEVLALRNHQVQQADRTGQPGYDLRLRVTDKLGNTNTLTSRVVFYDPVPVARPAVNPDTVGCGVDMTFSGVNSYHNHPDRSIVRYLWDFADGTSADTNQAQVTHRYSRMRWVNGAATAYPATLTVVDSTAAARQSVPVTVSATLRFANRPPVADPGGPYTTTRVNDVVTPVQLDGSGSFDPDAPCDAVASYDWDTDNDGLYGAEDVNGSPYSPVAGRDCTGAVVANFVSNNWQNGTRIPISLRVTDAYGAQTVSEAVFIEIIDTAPPMVQLVSPNGGELLARDAPIIVNYGLVSSTGAKTLVLDFTINGSPVALLDPLTYAPLNTNRHEVVADGQGTIRTINLRFDTRLFPSRSDLYRMQVQAWVKTNAALSTTVLSRRAFTIDNDAPVIVVGDNRFAQENGNLVTWRLNTLGRSPSHVRVAGSFNNWSAANLDDEWRLKDTNGDGVFQLTHHLNNGQYPYKFVLFFPDGTSSWWLDPTNPATADDGNGGLNNVLNVPVSYPVAQLEQSNAAGTRFVLQGVTVRDTLDANPTFGIHKADSELAWALDRTYPLGTTKLTLVGRDWAGNFAFKDLAVRIADRTQPTVSTGPAIVAEAVSPAGTTVRLQPTFWDLCDAQLLTSGTARDAADQALLLERRLDGTFQGSFPLGVNTVQFSAEDDSGNQRSASVTVTLRDTLDPLILLDEPVASYPQTTPDGVPSQDVVLPEPTLVDNGSSPAQMECVAQMTLEGAAGPQLVTVDCGEDLPAGLFFPPGNTLVTFQATDRSGNSSEALFLVQVVDGEAPEVELVGELDHEHWNRGNVVLSFTAIDATDLDPSVTVDPLPVGQAAPVRNGNLYTLTYRADGLYDVRIQVEDDRGNRSMRVVPRFGIDTAAPQPRVTNLPTEGVVAGQENTYPLYFNGESMSPTFEVADPLSGVVHLEATVLPGTVDSEPVVLFSRNEEPAGRPLTGRHLVHGMKCSDAQDTCNLGQLRLRNFRGGAQGIIFSARDAVGNAAELTVRFKMTTLDQVIQDVLANIALYKAQNPGLAGKLNAVERNLVTARLSLVAGYLGGCLLSLEDAVKDMESKVRFQNLPALKKDASLLARGAYSEVHMYWEDQAVGTWEEVKAADLLENALEHRQNEAFSASVLACENAYFYTRNAEVPFRATEVYTSIEALEIILEEMRVYLTHWELPGRGDVDDARALLLDRVLWKFEDLRDFGWLGGQHYMNLMLDLQDMVGSLGYAEDRGTWVRNWQFGLGQLIRVVVDVAMSEAQIELGPDHCRILEAQQQYDRGMDLLDQRDADEMLSLYASEEIRCLILYIYTEAGFAPAFPPEEYGCWVDEDGHPPACD